MGFLFPRRKKFEKPIPQTVHNHSLLPVKESNKILQPSETKAKGKQKVYGNINHVSCLCCGAKVSVNNDWKKFKCSICYTTNYVGNDKDLTSETSNIKSSQIQYCSLEQLKILIKQCYHTKSKTSINDNDIAKLKPVIDFEPVTAYLSRCFHDINILERSFLNLNSPIIINIDELKEFYSLIMQLPTRRPFYKMLCACNDLLKRPKENINRYRWIFIIWEIPTIRNCLTFKNDSFGFDVFRIKSVAYELVKRCIGYLSNILNNTDRANYQVYLTYLRYIPKELFLNHVETINLYLTYQLTKIYSKETSINKKNKKAAKIFADNNNNNTNSITTNNSLRFPFLVQQDNSTVDNTGTIPFSSTTEQPRNTTNLFNEKILNSSGKNNDQKYPMIKTFKYQNNWHLETAANLMKIYHLVNYRRVSITSKQMYGNTKLSINSFYNTMLDFIDYKDDFNNWEGLEIKKKLNDIIMIEEQQQRKKFSFCRYPFLLSLGVKISIMEYETRRIMEYHAEMAFLDSLDKGKNIPVYFKIRVRRDHIVQDSLNAIKEHQGEFLKSLRIEFINERGIDAGGLRKEWFMLLTKKFFDKNSILFETVSESRYTWFIIYPPGASSAKNIKLLHLYFLFGVVVGLAIFNGVILDLKFPRLFYKKMCNEQIGFADYLELYPETGRNLQRLLDYDNEDFVDVFSLTFETVIKNKDITNDLNANQTCSIELCNGGSKRVVTLKNKHEYVHLWINYYLNTNVNEQFSQFMKGFNKVFDGCNSIKLFNSEELERLLCGDIQSKEYDFVMLRSVTKYKDGYTDKTPVIEWFWDIISHWGIKLQSKLLQFVTGSDRIPATGINTLSFRISRLSEGDDTLLPVAHTCFNELSLPEYSDKKILQSKLIFAITECQGFEFR